MNAPPVIAALIATCNRPKLLARRALPSVAAQTRRPDVLVIVDDSLRQFRERNRRTAKQFAEETGIRVLYLQNRRNKGASGAWNTGAFAILSETCDASRTYIAILDDDDEWLPEHLTWAEKAARRGADLIAVPFLRIERGLKQLMRPPESLKGGDFLIGNPGVGCGSLIVRLSTFCRAGMFDESMPACTDRDICFRISQLSGVSYCSTRNASMLHYADDGRVRLSGRLGKNRMAGLSAFVDKYRGWMSDDEYAAFRKRAEKLFGWRPSRSSPPPAAASSPPPPRKTGGKTDAIALVVGVIVPSSEKDNPLFADVAKLSKDKRLSSLDVVVMPSSGAHAGNLRREAAKWRQMGIRVYCLDGAHAAVYIRQFVGEDVRKLRPIAVNRTILQHVVWRVAKSLRNPVCWILDGDSRLHGLALHGKSPAKFTPDYVDEMLKLRASGCDVAIGGVNGAAPLPRASSVRAQMTDLLFCFSGLARRRVQYRPKMTVAAMPSVNISKDYYYDYGENPHLEQPAGLSPLPGALTRERFVAELPRWLNRILAGDAVTRPLLNLEHVALGAGAAAHRGGNTLVFNRNSLRACPNGFARGVFSSMRRQDEIWRIIGESSLGWKVVGGNFPITQSRENDLPQAPDIERMAADIVGHATSAGLRKIAGKKRFSDVQKFVDSVLQNEFAVFSDMENAARERLTMVRASFYRISGIADSMRGLMGSTLPNKNAENAAALSSLKSMGRRFSQNKFLLLEKRVIRMLNRSLLRETLGQFPAFCAEFYQHKIGRAWLANERRLNATAVVQRLGAMGDSFRVIGQGMEGVVFSNGRGVCKVLHNWYSRAEVADSNFLLSLRGKWNPDSDVVYPIVDFNRDGGDLLLSLPYEKTSPYRGGVGAGLVAMLAEFRKRGIALWNISPENMRICGDKIRFVDYGNDIRPMTEKDFDLSARRAWLCWRWAWRDDLSVLLSDALTNPNLPELTGYENLKAAVTGYAAQFRFNESVMREALSHEPRRVFDFGCGKNSDAVMLAKRGIEVCAYDPAMSVKKHEEYSAAGVKALEYGDIASAGVFDVVILHNVICEIVSDGELRRCLKNVRRLAGEFGKVVVTACDVDGILENTCASNLLPRGFDINGKFLYRKRLRKNGAVRPHVHRSADILLREFARAGFKMVSREEFSDIDLGNFAPCGGGVRWILKPMPPLPPTSLILRACAMDSDVAESQAQFLIRQLGFPRGFAEVILAIDPRRREFLREHRPGDLAKLLAVSQKLRRRGIIDRVVVSPKESEKEKIRKLNRVWTGTDFDFTHARNGAPLSAVFAAFERCRTPYALHVDIDMIVGRTDNNHDYLGAMLRMMEKRRAITMALDIAGADGRLCEQKGNPYRLEVRAGLTHVEKMKALRPLPFEMEDKIPAEGWHRAADSMIRVRKLPSLRGGGQRLFAMHPPNRFKKCEDALDIVANATERGFFPEEQRGKNEWDGEFENWLPPPRRERFVFVICGRNVDGGRIGRCLNSIECQKFGDWGAIVMDDASFSASAVRLREWAKRHPTRATYFARRRRVGGLANLVFAVRYLCGDPKSVIVTLDMDDALSGDQVLTRLAHEYRRGADLTVGSMLRFDKRADYPVRFDNPYANRGGNVWQHLRSFRKELFDVVPDSAMRDDDGGYFSIAGDWAYMLPMVKMAHRPVWIRDVLYLYEPDIAAKKTSKPIREDAIARIMSRSRLIKRGRN